MNDELQNVYYDIDNVLKGSTVTLNNVSVSSLTVSRVASISSGTFTNLIGVKDGSSACAGCVGEYFESKITSNQNFPTSTQYGDATSISLTPGDWDISAVIHCNQSAANVTLWELGISVTSGNSSAGLQAGDNYVVSGLASTAGFDSLTIPVHRRNVSAQTVIYMKVSSTYTAAIPVYQGRISARRVR